MIRRKATEISTEDLFAQVQTNIVLSSGMVHHNGWSATDRDQEIGDFGKKAPGAETYPDNGRVTGNGRRVVLLGRGTLLNSQVLDIASPEDDELVDLIGRGYLLVWIPLPALGTIGPDVLQGNSRV